MKSYPVKENPVGSVVSEILRYKQFNILQWNINGLKSKCDDLLHYMKGKNHLLAALQETKMTIKSKLMNVPNYTLVRKDRGVNKGGGLAFLIHKDINFNIETNPAILEQDEFLEVMTIRIPGINKEDLYVRNIYIPPQSSCRQQYVPPLEHLYDGLGKNAYVIGDLNAHNELWYSEANADSRGRDLVDTISGLDFGIINNDLPTRVTNQASTAPDVSIASSNLIPYTTWKVERKLNSDHLPITISLNASLKKNNAKNRKFINFSKANWPKFTEMTEKIFSTARKVENVFQAEKYFRNTLSRAAKQCIPAGRIPKVYNAIPTAVVKLIEERDVIKQNNPADDRLNDINKNINKAIAEHRKIKWQEHLASCQANSKKLWNTINSLKDKPVQPDNQGISFNGKVTNNARTMANELNKQYTPCLEKAPPRSRRRTLRKLKKKPTDTTVIFTAAQTLEAIKKSKSSKALGPDGLSPIMLKHLGPNGIRYLTAIFNISVNKSKIPCAWKTGKIIPLLKPGKPADQGTSYRPVSLLCPASKILEALLLPYVNDAVKLADHQHGFRKGRSTTTALQSINTFITDGLNKKKPVDRTVSVAIDLSKAFDTVDHELLLQDIHSLQLNSHIKRFLCAYLRGRQQYVMFRGSRSKYRIVLQGVPQGGVLSPVLFNLYMSSMPQPPSNIHLVSYADDSNVLSRGPHVEPVVRDLNKYLAVLDEWFKTRNLHISPSKSSATIFTTFSNEASTVLDIEINGEKVPSVRHPKFLGVTYDNLFFFNHHAKELRTKLNAKNNMLKALSGTTWGKEKEVISSTYKAIGQSLFNYCCPIFTPTFSDASWEKLQFAQNSALRTATGCHLMTDIDHLHQETKIMPVKEHCQMLSKQFLLSTQRPNHPNRTNLNPPPPKRQMKETLVSLFGKEINKISTPDLPEKAYKTKLKKIHTTSVRDTINNYRENKVLNTRPPAIHKAENKLPRTTRSTLAQLRSGYSLYLNTFKARINKDPTQIVPETCPKCQELHTTNHLFNCRQNPTTLTARDLWSKPVETARFLGLPVSNDEDPG